jgi:hypothetical protein
MFTFTNIVHFGANYWLIIWYARRVVIHDCRWGILETKRNYILVITIFFQYTVQCKV